MCRRGSSVVPLASVSEHKVEFLSSVVLKNVNRMPGFHFFF